MRGLTQDKSTLITAIVLLVSGIVFIASPVSALRITLRIVGALILLWEGFDIYTKTRLFDGDKLVMLLCIFNDAFVIICALILLISPLDAIKALAFILGLYLLITSGMTVFRKFSGGGKAQFGETSILVVSIIVGFWLVLSPFDITRLTAICIGVALILKAVSEFWSYLEFVEKKDADDYVTDDFVDTTESLEDEINKLR